MFLFVVILCCLKEAVDGAIQWTNYTVYSVSSNTALGLEANPSLSEFAFVNKDIFIFSLGTTNRYQLRTTLLIRDFATAGSYLDENHFTSTSINYIWGWYNYNGVLWLTNNSSPKTTTYLSADYNYPKTIRTCANSKNIIYTVNSKVYLYSTSGSLQSPKDTFDVSQTVTNCAVNNNFAVFLFKPSQNPSYSLWSILTSKRSSTSVDVTQKLSPLGTVSSIYATDLYVFIGLAGSQKVNIYSRNLTLDSLMGGPNFGTYVTASSDSSLLLVLSDSMAYVFYKDVTWKSHYNFSIPSPTSGIIGKTSIGYVVLIATNEQSSTKVIYYHQITCSPLSYGFTCQNCFCEHGICNNSIWSTSGSCIKCNSNYFGRQCRACSCQNGVCNDGISGNGLCSTCKNGWFNPNCSQACTCLNGVCDYGLNGTGLCTRCNEALTYGKNCDQNCSTCITCFSGIEGNGTCSNCTQTQYGQSCQDCLCNTGHGNCDSGTFGKGDCLSCSAGYYGPLCNMSCTCKNGTCNDGISGTGHCLSCQQGYFGLNCESRSTCVNGLANAGPDGDGKCLYCYGNYFGANCEKPCTCSASNPCNNGTQGDGTCITCNSTTYGKNCENQCTCKNGTCNNLPGGNGTCISCNSDSLYGTNCDSPCVCPNGECSTGVTGNGSCIFCNEGFFGALCDKTCNCLNGNCNGGINGTGDCYRCNPNSFGSSCQQCLCNTTNGQCNDGITGDGHCESCYSGYYGKDCNQQCNCSGNLTYCYNSTSNGGCLNECDLFTHNCEQICVMRNMSDWICACQAGFRVVSRSSCQKCPDHAKCENELVTISGTKTVLDGLITGTILVNMSNVAIQSASLEGAFTFQNANVSFNGHVSLDGQTTFSQSSIIITSGSVLSVSGDFIFHNTKLFLSKNSSFTLLGCATVSNSSLIITDVPTNEHNFNLTIFNFTDTNCTTNPFDSIHLETADCRIAQIQPVRTKDSLIYQVSFDDSNCTFPLWIIIASSVAGGLFLIAIIVVISVFASKNLTQKIFPFRNTYFSGDAEL